jgi:ABC-2 type transport system ATP-binding protein
MQVEAICDRVIIINNGKIVADKNSITISQDMEQGLWVRIVKIEEKQWLKWKENLIGYKILMIWFGVNF